jgi:hypothetical protein
LNWALELSAALTLCDDQTAALRDWAATVKANQIEQDQ